jgi:Flp pilus assembly pilin Flp
MPAGCWLRSRQPAQDVVEYALIVVALAFVGIVALHALGGAEATVFGASATPLAQPTPGAGTFLHTTSMTMTCGAPTIFIVGSTDPTRNQVTCTVTVTDMDRPAPTIPQGTILMQLDSTITPCALNANSSASSVCVWNHVWQVGEGDSPGRHTLSARYQPTSNHSVPNAQSANFTVRPWLTFQPLQCTNPWHPELGTNATEIGHPLQCGLQVTDVARGGPPPALTGPYAPMLSSSTGGTGGVPYFSCLPQTFGSLRNDVICPAPTATWTCQTNASGVCAFEYRRIYDNGIRGVGSDTITAVAFPGDLQWPTTTANVAIDPPVEPHNVGVTTQCSSTAPGLSFANSPEPVWNLVPDRAGTTWGPSLNTDHAILHTGTYDVQCHVIVFDGETPNPFFDSALDNMSCPFAVSARCAAADNQAHPPLGQVSLVDPATNTVYGSCSLQHSPGVMSTLVGQSEYASACPMTLHGGTLPGTPPPPQTTTTLKFVYTPAEPGHTSGSSVDIAVNTQ